MPIDLTPADVGVHRARRRVAGEDLDGGPGVIGAARPGRHDRPRPPGGDGPAHPSELLRRYLITRQRRAVAHLALDDDAPALLGAVVYHSLLDDAAGEIGKGHLHFPVLSWADQHEI